MIEVTYLLLLLLLQLMTYQLCDIFSDDKPGNSCDAVYLSYSCWLRDRHSQLVLYAEFNIYQPYKTCRNYAHL